MNELEECLGEWMEWTEGSMRWRAKLDGDKVNPGLILQYKNQGYVHYAETDVYDGMMVDFCAALIARARLGYQKVGPQPSSSCVLGKAKEVPIEDRGI